MFRIRSTLLKSMQVLVDNFVYMKIILSINYLFFSFRKEAKEGETFLNIAQLVHNITLV